MKLTQEQIRMLEYVNITMDDINKSVTNIYEHLVDNENEPLRKELTYLIRRLKDILKSIEDEKS